MSAASRRSLPGLTPPGLIRGIRIRWIPLLALLAVAALGLALAAGTSGNGQGATGRMASRSPGSPAPGLAGQTLTGDPFDLAALRGQVVLVNIFASWCGPCRDELALLAEAQGRWSARGLHVVGVDVRDSAEAVHALLDETGAGSLTVLPDPTGTTAVDWGVRGVPETFLVDRDGRIAHWEPGPVNAQWLDQRLTPLVAS